MIDPVGQIILKKINERIKAESTKENISYRMQCPKCRKWIIKDILMKEGCFVCSWKFNGG